MKLALKKIKAVEEIDVSTLPIVGSGKYGDIYLYSKEGEDKILKVMKKPEDVKLDDDQLAKLFESELAINQLVSKTNPYILTAENYFMNKVDFSICVIFEKMDCTL